MSAGAAATGGRDGALDAYRGLAVAGMALVNLEDPFRPVLRPLLHSDWNGLTFADLVFPAFVLGVGLSTALALDRAGADGRPGVAPWPRVLRRGLGLVAVGLALNWLLHPSPRPADLRASGVLQRIGFVYLACAACAKHSTGVRTPLAWAAALTALHAAVLLWVAAPGEAAGVLAPGRGVAAWLDRSLLPGRILHGGHDPEGVLSTLSAVAQGLVGLAAMRRARRGGADGRLAAAACALVLGGAALAGLLPLNKPLWTPSYALVTAGAGLLLWLALRRAWPRVGATGPARGAAWLGRAALTFYVVHTVLIAALLRKLGGVRLWDVAAGLPTAAGLPPAWASLAAAFALSALSLLATAAIARRPPHPRLRRTGARPGPA